MGISINQFRTGLNIILDGVVFTVVGYEHVKPGKGGAFCRARLKNIKTGQVLEKTFRDSDRIEEAYVEERKLQFIYNVGDDFYFMDLHDYNNFPVSKKVLKDAAQFIKEGIEINGLFFAGEIISVELPAFVELKVESTEPGLKGDSVKAGTKPAILETGAVIQVPLFIEAGDVVKIDTRSGTYVERI